MRERSAAALAGSDAYGDARSSSQRGWLVACDWLYLCLLSDGWLYCRGGVSTSSGAVGLRTGRTGCAELMDL